MVVTNIVSCIRVTKENNVSGMDMYLDVGANIKVIDDSGNEFQGKLMYLELSQYEEQDDILHIQTTDGKTTSIGISYIHDIEELS